MRRYMDVMAICLVCLLLISVLGITVSGDTDLKDDPIEIKNNDYWTKQIEELDQEYTIRVNTSFDTPFDVYILDDKEIGKYKDNEKFKPEISKENINDTDYFTFEFSDRSENWYLVVDNRDNANENDAYANSTITVYIKLERPDDDWIWQILVCSIPITGGIVLLVIIIWIIVNRNRPQRSYEPWLPIKNPPIRKRR